MVAYVVMMRERTHDAKELEVYGQMARTAMPGHSAKPLAIYGKLESLEGAPVEGAVILEFPTFEEAKAWYDSPGYQDARKHRFQGADYRGFIVQGM